MSWLKKTINTHLFCAIYFRANIVGVVGAGSAVAFLHFFIEEIFAVERRLEKYHKLPEYLLAEAFRESHDKSACISDIIS